MASFFIMRIWPFDWMTIDIFDPQPFSSSGWLQPGVSIGRTLLHPVSVSHMTPSYQLARSIFDCFLQLAA